MIKSVNPPVIELAQLENLMWDLANEHRISIRLKIEGQAWPEHFSIVVVFARHAILLAHMPTRSVTNITDLGEVTAFELDRPHKVFLPWQR